MDGALAELRARGLDEPYARRLVEQFPQERIWRAVEYFDGLTDVGPGLLVTAIREGRQPISARRDLMADQQKYADAIVAWLREHFPDLDRPIFGQHPAAVAAVIRLRWRYGTADGHEPEVRAAVERWEDA